MKIEGVIFDLDDTLFDCTGQLTDPARHRAAQVFATAKPGLNIDDLCEAQKALAATGSSSDALRQIAREHDLSEAVVQQAHRAYNISVMFPDDEDRWRWVTHGLNLLREKGLHYNPGSAKLYNEMAWILNHKIGDEMDRCHWYYKQRWWGDMNTLLVRLAYDL